MNPPAIFLSHGAPDVILHEGPTRRLWDALGRTLPRPRAVVIPSAHYLRRGVVSVSSHPRPATVHDFRGFDPGLRTLRYPAPGDPVLAGRAVGLLSEAGLPAREEPDRGFDHGVWVPAARLWPLADVPLVSLSIDPGAGPRHHLEVGQALAPLLERGVLMLASGAATHQLAAMDADPDSPRIDPRAQAFADWLAATLSAGDLDALLDYRRQAPAAAWNHPSEEHLMPLFVALGAAPAARVLGRAMSRATLAMDAYAFSPSPAPSRAGRGTTTEMANASSSRGLR